MVTNSTLFDRILVKGFSLLRYLKPENDSNELPIPTHMSYI